MTTRGFALFDTSLGLCGIAWGPNGIVASQLPELSPEATKARLLKRLPDAVEGTPPLHVQAIVDDLVATLKGEPRDLTHIALDTNGVPAFNQSVYDISRAIPRGTTRTYGEIARQIGDVSLSRAVGQALGQNPFAPIVPCHRILAANSKSGGFSASGGVKTKIKLLMSEGWRPEAPDLFGNAF